MKTASLIPIIIVLALACSNPSKKGESEWNPDNPTGINASLPSLYRSGDGIIFLTWVEPGEKEGVSELYLSEKQGNKWTEKELVASGEDWFVNWADFPSVIQLKNRNLAAYYLAKNGKGDYAYGVNLSIKDKTWQAPLIPHDNSETEHGFVSMVPTGNSISMCWLDGRMYVSGESGEMAGQMQLRFAEIESSGNIKNEFLLDDKTCDCCQTTLVKTSKGLLAAYRDRTEEEIRDISVVQFKNGLWTEPVTLFADNWKINGCPVNGPSAASAGDTVIIAWYTAPNNSGQVKVCRSTDGGATFSMPLTVDMDNPIGRVKVCTDGKRFFVAWIGIKGKNASIMCRELNKDYTLSEAIIVAPTSAERSSGFPQMVSTGEGLLFAWTVDGEPSSILIKELSYPNKVENSIE